MIQDIEDVDASSRDEMVCPNCFTRGVEPKLPHANEYDTERAAIQHASVCSNERCQYHPEASGPDVIPPAKLRVQWQNQRLRFSTTLTRRHGVAAVVIGLAVLVLFSGGLGVSFSELGDGPSPSATTVDRQSLAFERNLTGDQTGTWALYSHDDQYVLAERRPAGIAYLNATGGDTATPHVFETYRGAQTALLADELHAEQNRTTASGSPKPADPLHRIGLSLFSVGESYTIAGQHEGRVVSINETLQLTTSITRFESQESATNAILAYLTATRERADGRNTTVTAIDERSLASHLAGASDGDRSGDRVDPTWPTYTAGEDGTAVARNTSMVVSDQRTEQSRTTLTGTGSDLLGTLTIANRSGTNDVRVQVTDVETGTSRHRVVAGSTTTETIVVDARSIASTQQLQLEGIRETIPVTTAGTIRPGQAHTPTIEGNLPPTNVSVRITGIEGEESSRTADSTGNDSLPRVTVRGAETTVCSVTPSTGSHVCDIPSRVIQKHETPGSPFEMRVTNGSVRYRLNYTAAVGPANLSVTINGFDYRYPWSFQQGTDAGGNGDTLGRLGLESRVSGTITALQTGTNTVTIDTQPVDGLQTAVRAALNYTEGGQQVGQPAVTVVNAAGSHTRSVPERLLIDGAFVGTANMTLPREWFMPGKNVLRVSTPGSATVHARVIAETATNQTGTLQSRRP